MKSYLIIVFLILLKICFSFIIKKNKILIYDKNFIWRKSKKKKEISCNRIKLVQNEINKDCIDINTKKIDDNNYEGKSEKFINAIKEEDYNYLYLYHIYKKVKIIKKEKYIYNPTKYESVRSYIKRELNECLDVNTSSYIFKISEFYSKNILDVSVYVNEITNILSFFTFNSSYNLQSNENKNIDYKDIKDKNYNNEDFLEMNNSSIKGNSNNQNKLDICNDSIKEINNNINSTGKKEINIYDHLGDVLNNDKNISNQLIGKYKNKFYNNETSNLYNEKINNLQENFNEEENIFKKLNESQSKTKITKLINRDEKYKSFCFYFFRLVDSISGLFCCLGKRRKREELYNFLQNLKLIDKVKNYNINDICFSSDFMIYIIRLTKYKDMNFICSLKKLKVYKLEEIKKIFLNCLHDNLLDINYLKYLEYEFIKKEQQKKQSENKIILNVEEFDKNLENKNIKNINYDSLNEMEKEYNNLLKKYSKEKVIKDNLYYNENDLKNIINDILNKNVFIKKKKKKKNNKVEKHHIFAVNIYEIEKERLCEILKKYNIKTDNINNLLNKMNNLLNSYCININIQLKLVNNNIELDNKKDNEKSIKINNSVLEDKDNKQNNEKYIKINNSLLEDKDNNSKKKEEEEKNEKEQILTTKTIDLSDVSLSGIKDYILYKKNEEKNLKNVTDERKSESESKSEGESEDEYIFKYFDIYPKQDSLIFEFNKSFLNEHEFLTHNNNINNQELKEETLVNLEEIKQTNYNFKYDNQNIDNKLDKNIDENINENFDENISENFDENTNENINENFDENTNENINEYFDENIDKNINENFDENTDKKIDENINENIDENFDKNINENFVENINENFVENTNENFVENTNENFDENINEKFDKNIDENFDKNIDENINENFVENTNENFDENINEIFDENTDKNIDENINENFDENINEIFDENIDKNIDENINENFDENINEKFDKNIDENINENFVENLNELNKCDDEDLDKYCENTKKKKKINKNDSEIEKLKLYIYHKKEKKYRYNFENVFADSFEKKMKILLFILKNENMKKVIVCVDEKERELIKMKCKIEKLEYDDILSTSKNVKHYINKEKSYKNSCFIFMNEIYNTLELRKIVGNLSERNDNNEICFYHFADNIQKAAVFKKLFYSITQNEDNYLFYLKSKNNNKVNKKDLINSKNNANNKKINDHTYTSYNKKKKKLSKSEEKWISFRRRTLKKIDEMKKKAELIKKKKAEKRDMKIKKIVAKLKSKERKLK
ncbi:conserved Plasmodium protein, unknown function [Plasmodium gallinaceum]|uniref:Uncharacterized protein n=1 Tax=Plasmodium gallinaceum TaxID=5849 RepID=A0A1J1GN17_PLAGA|nr:conserved Plasmodium protein, unknown function [Plasmodium gallinaceum]CRG93661.1 conserved Plasmodium protein, unknown function [Plasmodium gallinaceum]